MNTTNAIVLGQSDYRKLLTLGAAGEDLLNEIERAHVVDDALVPGDVVRMGSIVRYRMETGEERQVELVWPAEADIALGRIAVTTPIGTALIGVRVGQGVAYEARNGRVNEVTIVAVEAMSLAA